MIILPSLEIVPAKYNVSTNTLLSQIPIDGTGDFTVSRTTSPVTGQSTRVNALGQIELVADNVPRLDYPIGGGCPALLVEAGGTNGILNSQDTATNWSLGANLSSGYVDVIGVSGNNLTVAVSGSGLGASAGRLGRANNNFALASGSTYTISFLIKKTGTHTSGGYYALLTGAASGNLGGGFDVSGSFSSGVIYNTAGTTNRIRRIEQWGTDVFRCSETFTMTASGTLTSFFLAPVASVTSSNNSAVGTQLGFAAPQLELGSVPTSFIPTTTGSVTRNADVVSVSGAVSGSIGQTQGTIYAEVDLSRVNTNIIISLHDGVGNNRFIVYFFNSTTLIADIRVATVNANYSVTIPAIPANGGIYKVALGYKVNDYCFALNGTIYASTASRGVPTTTQVNLGSNFLGAAQLNDRIRAVALYTTRLTNAELALITQP